MPAFHTRWTVLSHGPLEAVADNLWRAKGEVPEFRLARRVMTVARRAGGDLVVHNAIALGDRDMARLDALGPVRAIVVPNGWHRLDARPFSDRYPEAGVYGPRGALARIRSAVPAARRYEEFVPDETVTLGYLPGVRPAEGMMTVRSSDGVTLVFNDLINNLPRAPGAMGLLYHLLAGTGRPGIHRFVGLLLVKDRAALRAELRRLAGQPDLRRVVVSHGALVRERAGEFLRAVAGG